MAVVNTPLGFQVPDGNDPIRNGDNVIAANAQTADALHANARSRLAFLEGTLTVGGSAVMIEDPADPGFYVIAPTGH